MAYDLLTGTVQSRGPERTADLLTHEAPVLSLYRITLENNEKIRLQPDRENAFAGLSGGGDGPDIQPSLPGNILILHDLTLKHPSAFL